jgi:hypothetical protein
MQLSITDEVSMVKLTSLAWPKVVIDSQKNLFGGMLWIYSKKGTRGLPAAAAAF